MARAIFLVGFMGAGKSTVGRALARRLRWPFEDLDDRVQAREGRTVELIFQESGEAAFREAEHSALKELLESLGPEPRVVALGGGAFVQARNAALLEPEGIVSVFLDGPVEELFRRCQQQSVERPLRRSLQQFRELLELRRPHYMKSKLRIETTSKNVEAVAGEIATRLGIDK
jgi:Shikimate kinase